MGKLKLDIEQAQRHLSVIDEEAENFYFQTFDDNKKRKDPSLVRVLYGSLEQHWEELEQLQNQGAGVFVLVHETDGKGRKKENIARIRAVWRENDNGNAPLLPIEPHLVVETSPPEETSPSKDHSYILTDSDKVSEFGSIQQRLVDDYGSDPNAKDLSRVLRLAGSWHLKNPKKPHLVRIVSESGEQPLPWDRIKQLFPPVDKPKHKNKPEFSNKAGNGVGADEEKRIREALSFIPADDYEVWLHMGQATHSAGVDFIVWDEWSQTAENYGGIDDQRRRWESFTAGRGITLGTLFDLAKKHGWNPVVSRPPEPPIEVYAEDVYAAHVVTPEPTPVSRELFEAELAAAGDDIDMVIHIATTLQLAPLHQVEIDLLLKQAAKQIGASVSSLKSKPSKPSRPPASQNDASVNVNQHTLRRYIFISSRNRIYDTITGKDMTREAFDGLLLHKYDNPKASNWLLKQKNCVKVDDLIYLPGKVINPVERDNSKLWNIWCDPGVKLPDQATDDDVELWLDHLNYLYPNQAEQAHILSWFAFTLQNPHTKINHALLIAGTPRIGKDTLLSPLRLGLGERNVCEPPAGELLETFTDYLHHTKLVIFQEIMNFEGLNLENKLKPMLAAPPDMLRVRLFGRGFYETPNIVQAVFMSNYRDALHISEGDGRYFAVWTDVKPLSQEYYRDLWRWLETGGNALVVRWLLSRDISGFNPKEPAPMTQFKSELIKTSHSPLKHQLLDMIEAFDYPFNVDCVRSLDVAKAMRDKYSPKAIGSVLSEIGCINRACKRSTGKREKASLYSVRNVDEWADKLPGEWFDEYDARKDRTGFKDTGT